MSLSAQTRTDAERFPRRVCSGLRTPKCITCANHVHGTLHRRVERTVGETTANGGPKCYLPLLGTNLGRVADLMAWWNAFHGCHDDRRLDDVQRALLARFDTDRWRFSEVFEPSCSYDRKGWHFWRFSYAFPDLDSDLASMIHDLLEVCRPFGDDLRSLVRTLLWPVREQSVRQPLVGLAYDTPTSWRLKLYLQFRDDAGDEPLAIATRLTGRTDLCRLFRKRSLHLVGIDLGPRGIVGAKLHFREPQIPSRDVPRIAGPVELIDYLADTGMDQMRDLLVIHRMKQRDDP